MEKLIYLEDFCSKGKVSKFEAHYAYGDYCNPTDFMADFFSAHKIVPVGCCSDDKEIGDYNIYFPDFRFFGGVACVEFFYEGNVFEIKEKNLEGGRVIDCFKKFLTENEIPWKRLE